MSFTFTEIDDDANVAADPESETRRRSVLVAEDHDDTRMMLRIILEMNGFSVFEAANGIEAVRLTQLEQPDLVLMDYTLPLIDGLAATRLIRAFNLTENVPIIFLSGHAEPAPQIAAFEAGCNHYVVKPVNLDQMMKLITRTLSVRGTLIEDGQSFERRNDGNSTARNSRTF